MKMKYRKSFIGNRSIFISIIYALFGGGWILFSDTYLDRILEANEMLRIFKGSLFAIVTACLLYIMIRRSELSIKRTSEAFQLEAQKFRELFENANDGIFLFELQTGNVPSKFIEANRVACGQLGYTRDEFLSMSPLDITHEERLGIIPQLFQNLLEKESLTWEGSNVSKDGQIVDCEFSARVFTFYKRRFVLSVVRDITERKKNEELLLKSEKLAVVGELAAGIAHEIRNPLTSIKGFLQLLARNKENTKYCSTMLTEVERINEIVSEFLMIAKPQAEIFKPVNIQQLIDGVIVLLNTHAILNNVQIILDCDSSIPFVTCVENRLKQVIINILKNAIDAMPNGGEVLIKLRLHGDDRILIRVIDHGCGIPEERLSKLGEPFYTTKEKGTGLGLMISQRIMATHNGSVLINSKENVGTTVDITLPIEEKHISSR